MPGCLPRISVATLTLRKPRGGGRTLPSNTEEGDASPHRPTNAKSQISVAAECERPVGRKIPVSPSCRTQKRLVGGGTVDGSRPEEPIPRGHYFCFFLCFGFFPESPCLPKPPLYPPCAPYLPGGFPPPEWVLFTPPPEPEAGPQTRNRFVGGLGVLNSPMRAPTGVRFARNPKYPPHRKHGPGLRKAPQRRQRFPPHSQRPPRPCCHRSEA